MFLNENLPSLSSRRPIAKFLADKLLLYKKNDGYGFHEENTGD
jgi:hypothetical protein